MKGMRFSEEGNGLVLWHIYDADFYDDGVIRIQTKKMLFNWCISMKTREVRLRDVKVLRYESRLPDPASHDIPKSIPPKNGIHFYTDSGLGHNGQPQGETLRLDPTYLMSPEVRDYLDRHLPDWLDTTNMERENNWKFIPHDVGGDEARMYTTVKGEVGYLEWTRDGSVIIVTP